MSPRERLGDGPVREIPMLETSLDIIDKEDGLPVFTSPLGRRRSRRHLNVYDDEDEVHDDLVEKPSQNHHPHDIPMNTSENSIESETTKATKIERFVRFADNIRTTSDTLALWQYSIEEIEATWFTEEEFFDIRRNIMMALKTEEELGEKAANDAYGSFRGLEIRTRVGTQARIQSIKASVQSVIAEQNSQRMIADQDGDCIYDWEAIAAKYSLTTSSHVLWAHMMGISDKRAADLCELEELLQTREEQQPQQSQPKPKHAKKTKATKRKVRKDSSSKSSSTSNSKEEASTTTTATTKTKKKRKKESDKEPEKKSSKKGGKVSKKAVKQGEEKVVVKKKQKEKGPTKTKSKKSSSRLRKRRSKDAGDDDQTETASCSRLGEESSIYGESCESTYFDESCDSTYFDETVCTQSLVSKESYD